MADPHVTPSGIVVEFRQHDFIPGFAAYLHEEGKPFPDGKAFCAFNLSAFLQAHVELGETPAALAESLADTMVHEVVHVIEAWAGVEFSEARVERLIADYRGHAATGYGDEDAGMDFSSALYLARHEGRRIRRKGWESWIEVIPRSEGGAPIVAWFSPGRPGWLAYHMNSDDMLAEDWEVVPVEAETPAPPRRARGADLPQVGTFHA
ncbi:hypothetical protein ABZT49_12230 [Methylobacterium sp. EM32]|uniref:Thoeris anti-defense Tad2 family protein n=1 Tax=Methylobacterium sp. EM32 TaxID=3163481 RepID=UPI0033BF0980